MTTERVMLAALDAFAASGFDAMSVRELNDSLGVSHNYLHRRFGSKLELWRAVVDHWIGGVNRELLALVDEAGQMADPLEVLREVIVRFVTLNCRQPQLFRLMNIEASIEGERLDYLFERFIEPTSRRFEQLFDELAPEVNRQSMPPATLFFLLAHGATAPAGHVALASRLSGEDPTSPTAIDRHAGAVADLFIDGLRER